MKTVEAIIEPTGEIRLIEPVRVSVPTRALVTILEEPPERPDTALLSEAALAEDWNRTEEDVAWAYLQPESRLSPFSFFRPEPVEAAPGSGAG
jgi:hypothetical protein